ncbi:MAG: glycosyltransferase family 1 protein [Candidatus Margulisiibacteriota bacterium]|nr:MAG: hypothetical protein A2X43_13215 [Candidatus Margulisbacteria bacterium GWD2_39_127]OGI04783.1 MAG: hypothetical protein A2X42_10780 [Candidatus Margulisbacteria bacterium GWF2_38_17]OGI05728.1 MAG: hypothetical protein A2X41_03365 [Candidatus Margulisbacteria bacterium GWE2_39_32]PZM83663.1 MAG: glycosyltransferase family 1 protein [Candidatus Margulisiibacteriota bacterium]HAR62081.1 glycosyltransferase family 1 protein [Candidatus Margulisiibacteriota bacterium]
MNNKKKILFLIQLPPPVHGVSTMNKIISDSKLINGSFDTRVFPLMFASDISDIGVVSVGKIVKMLICALKLVRTLLADRPDIAYFTLAPAGYAFYRDIIYVFILKIFKLKIIYHLHGKGIKNIISKHKLNKVICKFIFKNVNVICLSDQITYDIQDVYGKKPFIVNNGIVRIIDSNYFEEEKNNRDIKIKILFLSNYEKTKGILDLVDALRILDKKNIDFETVLVGKPTKSISIDYLKEYITNNGLIKKIKISGPQYNDNKNEILKNASIFVFPTYNEAFPLVILEAMQFGLPVVSTFEGAIPEIVDDCKTGFLVRQRDVTLLAEKIEILIKDKDMRIKMGRAGRIKFLEKYTLETFERNMKKIFDEVLNDDI